jgi:hypothetical protein
MKNLILLMFVLVGYDYISKDIKYVPIVDTIGIEDRYYEELRQKRLARALIAKAKYSDQVIANNN